MKRILHNKIVRKLILYIPLFFIVFGVVYGLAMLLIIVDTKMDLKTTIYHKQSITFVDQDDLDMLYSEHGEENVTRINRYFDRYALYTYFVDSSFITTGMTAYNPSYDRDIVEQIELIDGEIWEKGSTEKVVVIDQRTAERLYLSVGDQYELFTNSGEYYTVIGIVTNTSLPGTRRGEDLYSYETYITNPENIPNQMYLPYELTKTAVEYEFESVDTVLVKSDSIFDVKKDTDTFGTYLEEKLTTETAPNSYFVEWNYNYINVINLNMIMKSETSDPGFSIFHILIYGFTLVFVEIGIRQYKKYKTQKQ